MATRSVLITGCSSGMGQEAARGLKQRGYRVFATARKKQDVESLEAEGFEACQLDLADSGSICRAVDWVLERTGGTLYGLFNNAAYGQPGAVEDLSRDVLRQQFETNVFGTHELTVKLIPVMRKQGYGRIIQNSSMLGFVTFPYNGAYCATKYALESLSDALRLELKGSGIYVSIIEPGPIETKFRESAFAAYKDNINAVESDNRKVYKARQERFSNKIPFILPASSVVPKVIHALESDSPKARYPLTVPTYLFAYLKRILPTWALDYVLRKAAG